MSHFRSFPTKLTDAEILLTSLRDLGIHAITDSTVRGVNGQRIRADIVAVLEGECDIGWSRNVDGSFDNGGGRFVDKIRIPNIMHGLGNSMTKLDNELRRKEKIGPLTVSIRSRLKS